MKEKTVSVETARDILLSRVKQMGTEKVSLEKASGRVIAQDIIAAENVPPFDRSPYDGYAFRAEDVQNASKENPVTLKILEEIPAGGVPHCTVTEGTAVKILTGAPVPPGADAVQMFEKTEFTADTVTLFKPLRSGDNVVYAGEDVKKGTELAKSGTVIDAGLMGTLAGQCIANPEVYRRPMVGIISTGTEVRELDEELEAGKIYNSNRYTFTQVLGHCGCDSVYLGRVKDSADEISALINKGLASCDALILTGGVSVGDYDLTPEAMEKSGCEMLFLGVEMKPGMGCAYGVKDGVLVCGLSGNPASALTNFYAVALPAIRKLTGLSEYIPDEITVTLKNGFKKKSPSARYLRGKLDLSSGKVLMELPSDQGNVVLSSVIGCNVIALVPAGSGPLEAGTELKGFVV